MPRPAIVKFIGSENMYRLGHDGCGSRYCRDCKAPADCDKAVILQFTEGKTYHAFFVEYWQGKRNSLHVKNNAGEIVDFIPLNDFEIVSDPDNILNDYEATVRCITHEYDDELFELSYGKMYLAIGRDKDGLYLVMDDSSDCYFYPADCFEIVEDKHGILNHQSVYYSYDGGEKTS